MPRPASNRQLRYALTLHLHGHPGPASMRELTTAVEDAGLRAEGRPGKAISDALRTEVARGRVVRVGRGRYAAGAAPRTTLRYFRRWLQWSLDDHRGPAPR